MTTSSRSFVRCPVCDDPDPNAFLRCYRPDCTDGREQHLFASCLLGQECPTQVGGVCVVRGCPCAVRPRPVAAVKNESTIVVSRLLLSVLCWNLGLSLIGQYNSTTMHELTGIPLSLHKLIVVGAGAAVLGFAVYFLLTWIRSTICR